MKTYKIRITPKARQNINEIARYLKQEVSSEVASKVKNGLIEAISRLETYPEAYQAFTEISSDKAVFRRIIKWNYKIVYTVEEEELIVLVVRIYHGKKDHREIIAELNP